MTEHGLTLAERFWRKVDKRGPDECWEWTAGRTSYGYGQIWSGGQRRKKLLAHRVAWELANGPIPQGEEYHGVCVLHRYDNPGCCNPAHLFLGTHADNMRDMIEKERQAYGEANGRAKLTKLQVREVPHLAALGYSQRRIAHILGIKHAAVSHIMTGKTWRHRK